MNHHLTPRSMKKIIFIWLVFLLPLVKIQAQQIMWGVTVNGGAVNGSGNGSYGRLLKYDPANTTTPVSFPKDFTASDGTNPYGTVLVMGDGNLYGTTLVSGVSNNYGKVWKYNTSTATFSVVHSFAAATGQYPHGNMVLASNGKAYGLTEAGGANSLGVIYEIDITSGTPVFSKKIDLALATGSKGMGEMVEATAGKLIGVTIEGGANSKGVLFEYNYTTNTYTKKFDFDGAAHGSEPWFGLTKGTNGKFYGLTRTGGANDLGAIYEYDYATNTVTLKYSFSTADGTKPRSTMFIAGDGMMYGTTEEGGANAFGTLFQYNYLTNTFTKKVDYTGSGNGSKPMAGLVEVDGRLYGMTSKGGAANNGTIFEYDYLSNTLTKKYEWGSHVYGTGFPFMTGFAVQTCPEVTITTQPVNTTICSNGSNNFTVAATGTNLTYQWQVKTGAGGYTNISDNINYSGTTTATLTVGSVSASMDGYYYRCVISSAGCKSYSNNGILTVSSSSAVTPSVATAVTTGSNTMCSGSAITFTATPTNGGTTPMYQWKVNGTNVGTNSTTNTYSPTGLSNNDVVTVVMTSNATCASPSTATSTGITMNITPTVTPAVSIAVTTGSNSMCTNAAITFTATATNGGNSPLYQWKVGGVNVGSNSSTNTFSPTNLNNNDVVTCVLTSNATCVTSATATSNAITMNIGSSVTPSVSIAVTSGSNTTCSSSSVTFTATPTNGGTNPDYVWKKGTTVVGGNSATYTASGFADGDVITCVMTSKAPCPSSPTATSNSITMQISSSVSPSVSIAVTSGSSTTCRYATVEFTASVTNGGTNPTYQWEVNYVSVGGNTPTYSASNWYDGDFIRCKIISNAACVTTTNATSNTISMDISSTAVPSVSATITSGSSNTCSGTPVTFTATGTNGGTAPTYQWKVNGANVGSNSTTNTFTSSTLTDNAVVTVVMTSNLSCASPATATSPGTTMHIGSVSTPTISASGSVLTSSALSGNQWYFEGNIMTGETGRTLNAFAPGNYTVTVTNSGCSATSAVYTYTVTSVSSAMSANLAVYPNPSEGTVNVVLNNAQSQSLQLTVNDLYGSTVHEELLPGSSAQIDLSHLHKGVYFLHIQDGDNEGVVKVVIE